MKTLSSHNDLDAIFSRIALVSPTDTRLWGAMTAHQMICHLTDAFRCPLGERVPAAIKGPPIPVPVYRWLALRFPRKWPKGVPTLPALDQNIGGTPPGDFATDRAALVVKLDQFVRCAGPWGSHPLFGVMATAEWMRWGYLHTDHHLRQFGR